MSPAVVGGDDHGRPRVTGGDPHAIASSVADGDVQAARLRGVTATVVAACEAVRAGCDLDRPLPVDEVAARSSSLADDLHRLDHWTTRVAAALAAVDASPRTVADLRLQLLHDQVLHHRSGVAALPVPSTVGAALDVRRLPLLDDDALATLGGGADVPLALRDAANRIAVARRVARLDTALRHVRATLAAHERGATPWSRIVDRIDAALDERVFGPLGPVVGQHDGLRLQAARLVAERDALSAVMDDPAWLVLHHAADGGDPDHAPTLRLARGDLAAADHVAVVVPGTGSGVSTPWSALREGRELHAAATAFGRAGGPDPAVVAVVVELHGAPPDLLAAAGPRHARAAVPGLVAAVEELADGRHVTVVGHSHGAVVAGLAAREGLPADALVLLGAPGAGFDHVRDLQLRPGARVWSVRAPGDPIGLLADVDRRLALLPDGLRRLLPDGLTRPGGLHGPDTTDPASGTERFALDPACGSDVGVVEVRPPPTRGHVAYLDAGSTSLANVARIVVGGRPDADCHAPAPTPAPAPADDRPATR